MMKIHQDSFKREILKNTSPQADGSLNDRIDRYDEIIENIAMNDPEFRKYIEKSTDQMELLVIKTQKYIMVI